MENHAAQDQACEQGAVAHGASFGSAANCRRRANSRANERGDYINLPTEGNPAQKRVVGCFEFRSVKSAMSLISIGLSINPASIPGVTPSVWCFRRERTLRTLLILERYAGLPDFRQELQNGALAVAGHAAG